MTSHKKKISNIINIWLNTVKRILNTLILNTKLQQNIFSYCIFKITLVYDSKFEQYNEAKLLEIRESLSHI